MNKTFLKQKSSGVDQSLITNENFPCLYHVSDDNLANICLRSKKYYNKFISDKFIPYLELRLDERIEKIFSHEQTFARFIYFDDWLID